MNILATIGEEDATIRYTDRPTVKVIIKKDDKVLILNKGLLPGGGVDPGETELNAITRELQEELGVTVKDIQEIGAVVQYRDLLVKKYIVKGYAAELDTNGEPTNPQDEGEAQFTAQWFRLNEAMTYVSESVKEAELKPMEDDTNQGRLYNLITTLELLKNLQ